MSKAQAERLIEDLVTGRRRDDALRVMALISEVTGEVPRPEGKTIGFGSYHYRYETGKEGDFPQIAFTPTSQGITLYVMSGLRGFDDILERLGPHRVTKSTVKFNRLDDIDEDALVDLVRECMRHLQDVERELGAIPRMSEIPPRVPQ